MLYLSLDLIVELRRTVDRETGHELKQLNSKHERSLEQNIIQDGGLKPKRGSIRRTRLNNNTTSPLRDKCPLNNDEF